MTSSFPERSLTRAPMSQRTLFNTVMTVIAFICGVLALVPLLAVLSYVIIQGFSSLSPSVFFELPPKALQKGGGFGNAVLGTLLMVGIAAVISIPFGVLAAIYITEFSSAQVARWVRFAANVLSGVPSTVTQVVMPAALPAIVTGATLAIARASGETAPLLFTALFSNFWPDSLFQPTASLAVLVYKYAISPFKNWQSLAWAASLILVLMVLITSIIARWATRKKA